MRFLICGGRDFGNENEEWWFIHETLTKLINYDKYEYIVIINGAARGVDSISSEWARSLDIPVIEYPAPWDKYGKSAGFIRNKQMLDEAKPDWVLAFPGGPGTKMMTELSRRPKYKKAGVKVKEIEYPYVELTLPESGLESLD